jgi:hypothetical protein
MLAGWGFYGVATWGWVLVKGYNIGFAQWFDPLKPYEWTAGTPGMVPKGSMFPAKGSTATSTAAKVQVA